MTKMKYKVLYSDKQGKLEGSIRYDGEHLLLMLDGVQFSSGFMDDFHPTDENNLPPRFELDKNGLLTNFSLQFDLPLLFNIDEKPELLNLQSRLHIENDSRSYSRPFLACTLYLNDSEIALPTAGDIEGAIKQLNDQLPSNINFAGCYNCKFSDYSIFGQQFWGSMLCFRNMKEEYSRTKNKDEYMEIMDDFHEMVPESHYCNEFEERPEGHVGYRG